jgi:DNA-binding transcriptional regulator YiaG
MTFNGIGDGFSAYFPRSSENIPPNGKKRSQPEPPEGIPPAKEARISTRLYKIRRGYHKISEAARTALRQYSATEISLSARTTYRDACGWLSDTQSIPIERAKLLNRDLFGRKVFDVDDNETEDFVNIRANAESRLRENYIVISNNLRNGLRCLYKKFQISDATIASWTDTSIPIVRNWKSGKTKTIPFECALILNEKIKELLGEEPFNLNGIQLTAIYPTNSSDSAAPEPENSRVPTNKNELTLLNEFFSQTELSLWTFSSLMGNITEGLLRKLLTNKNNLTVYAHLARRANEIFNKMIFQWGSLPEDFSSEDRTELMIVSPNDCHAFREAIRHCPHLSRQQLARLLGVAEETVDGWSQKEGVQKISKYHAKRINQIFGKPIINVDVQTTVPIEASTGQVTTMQNQHLEDNNHDLTHFLLFGDSHVSPDGEATQIQEQEAPTLLAMPEPSTQPDGLPGMLGLFSEDGLFGEGDIALFDLFDPIFSEEKW